MTTGGATTVTRTTTQTTSARLRATATTTTTRGAGGTCVTYSCPGGFVPNPAASDQSCNPCDETTCCLATCGTYACPGGLVNDAQQVCGATFADCNQATCCITRRERRRRRRQRRRQRRFVAEAEALLPNLTPIDGVINTEDIMFLQGGNDGLVDEEEEDEDEL
eukprot:s250_g29.t1